LDEAYGRRSIAESATPAFAPALRANASFGGHGP